VTANKLGTLRDFAGDFVGFMGSRAWSAATLLLFGALIEGIGLVLLLPILNVVLDAGAGNLWIDALSRNLLGFLPSALPTLQLAFLLVLFALLLVARAIIILTRDTVLNQLQIGFVESHRLQIIRAITGTQWDVISRLRHGRITHVLGSDIQACGDAAYLLLQCAIGLAMLAGQILLVILLSPPLALIVVALLAGAALAMRPVLARSRRLGAALTDTNLSLVTSLTQFLGGLKLALSQNLQERFVAEFEETLASAAGRRVEFIRQRTKAQLALTAVAALVGGVAMLVGVGVLNVAPAVLIAFLFVLARMNGPVMQIQSSAQHIFHALPAYRKIKELESELGAHQPTASQPAPIKGKLEGRILFEAVSFVHRENADGEPAGGVRKVDLAIEQGSFIGVTGPSGAGKTTFADLLVGLYPPQSGRISVGGRPIEGETLLAWRQAISYVSQDPFLFHDTVRRNLLWARPGATAEDMWAVLRSVDAEPLVRRMPDGLDTVVGERGTLVSGGERQRIALARALLRRPSLLLLDEATNAIDVDGEREILLRLAAAPARPTIIMIAHRQASLSLCDTLVEFRGGQLVQQ
jgi:ATP-binding cassette subfamily C protein